MARPIEKRGCTGETADGRPCRAWAVHGSEPALCSAHLGRNVGAGAPRGNQNATTHGFYSQTYSLDEIADLLDYELGESLLEEIVVSRIALRRVMHKLKEEATAEEFSIMAGLAFQGAKSVAALLRIQRVIGGDSSDALADAIGQVLSEIGEELGRPL